MSMFFISIILVIIICVLLIGYMIIYNKFQILTIKINEAEANIDTTLRKRFDLLNKSINIIKSSLKEEKDVLTSIGKLRSKKLSNFDLDRQLYEAINEFNYYKENIDELNDNKEFIKIDLDLNDSEIELRSLRNYYNDIITEYNKLIKKFPSNLVAKIAKQKERYYFDQKNMNDDILNDFKL